MTSSPPHFQATNKTSGKIHNPGLLQPRCLALTPGMPIFSFDDSETGKTRENTRTDVHFGFFHYGFDAGSTLLCKFLPSFPRLRFVLWKIRNVTHENHAPTTEAHFLARISLILVLRFRHLHTKQHHIRHSTSNQDDSSVLPSTSSPPFPFIGSSLETRAATILKIFPKRRP